MEKNLMDSILEDVFESSQKLRIRYKDNNATKVPVFMSGTAHQIKTWLFHRQYDGFFKEISKYNKE